MKIKLSKKVRDEFVKAGKEGGKKTKQLFALNNSDYYRELRKKRKDLL